MSPGRKGKRQVEKFRFKGKSYDVDEKGYLLDFSRWDEDYAEGMAPKAKVEGGLTGRHWKVIRYIRDEFAKTGQCPSVFTTCKGNSLSMSDLKTLFPTGYMRGACLLAGISHRDHFIDYYGEAARDLLGHTDDLHTLSALKEKVYRVDAFGFLLYPSDWDECYAVNKAVEMKIPGGLTPVHRKIVKYLRESFTKNGVVPTVVECCEANGIELDDLERLFPDGYHRGAVKIAGLRAT
jgi:tRNA 2-thiouridine synthesizing protein E